MSYLSHQDFYATAGQTEFDVALDFLDAAHIKLKINGVETYFEWLTPSRIYTLEPIPQGASVRIYRETPIDGALVDFTAGAVLTNSDLNVVARQAVYRLQELEDSIGSASENAIIRLGSNFGITTNATQVIDEMIATNVFGHTVIDRFNQIVADVALDAETIIENTYRYIEVNDLITDVGYLDGVPVGAYVEQLAQTSFANGVAIANSVELLSARTNTALSGVYSSMSAYAANSNALTQTVTYLQANVASNRAELLDTKTAQASNNAVFTSRLDAQASQTNTALAQIGTLSNTVIANNVAQASQINLVSAQLTTANATLTAAIQDVRTAQVANDAVLASTSSTIFGRANSISLVANSASNNAGAAFNAANAAATVAANAAASVATETSLRIAADGVNANAIQAVSTQVNYNNTAVNSAILDTKNSLSTAIAANAATLTALATSFNTSNTALWSTVQQQATSISTANSTATTALQLTQSVVSGGTAITLNQSTTLATLSGTLVDQINGIKSTFNNYAANAYVISAFSAQTSATSAVANSVSVVQSQLNSNSATITTIQSTVNGLSGKAGVTIDVNGYLTGWALNNNGSSGTMTVLASKFAVVDPNAGAPIVPFEVSGGWVIAPKLRVGDLYADTITAGHIKTGAVDGTKIPSNQITNVHITNGAISTAATATSAGAVSAVTNTSNTSVPDLTVQSLSITTKGGQVMIQGGFNGFQQMYDYYQDGSDRTVAPVMQVIRDGSVIYSTPLQRPSRVYATGTRYQASYYQPFLFSEYVAAGAHSYEIRITGIPGNTAYSVGETGIAYAATNRHLAVLEIAKTGT